MIQVSQGTIYPEVCPECSSPTKTSVTQHLDDGKLVWSRARRCDGCGLAEVHDTDNTGMAFFRNLLVTERCYGVEFETASPAVVEALRKVVSATMPEAGDVSSEVACGRWRGTHPEAALLVTTLTGCGFSASIAER